MKTRVPGNCRLEFVGGGAHLGHDRMDAGKIVGARVVSAMSP